uniref:Uncharacterized protein n=1 Tax=Ophiognomonia clavigignenti-juglandacearum TaxID=218668 RepID=A0A291LJ38_9PEZI|nr:hypothetical protein [Ophiognomonia clavigignenti-juglandacearum]
MNYPRRLRPKINHTPYLKVPGLPKFFIKNKASQPIVISAKKKKCKILSPPDYTSMSNFYFFLPVDGGNSLPKAECHLPSIQLCFLTSTLQKVLSDPRLFL